VPDDFDLAPLPPSQTALGDEFSYAAMPAVPLLREEPTQPSPRPEREAAELDEFDIPLPGPGPVGLPPKRGHIFSRATRAPVDPGVDPGADPDLPKRRGSRRHGARARADHHRTYAAKGAGPDVFRLFHRLLALSFLLAFWSLGRQVDVLIGARGLLPVVEFMDVLHLRPNAGFLQFPTFFWWGTDHAWIAGGITLGLVLSAAAFIGVLPRILLLAIVPLYLGYATVCRTFLSFQWDSMLIEAGLLAIFLPRDIRSPVMLLGFRLLLFKLYFESGIAKWQSHLGDWQDGSAMVLYYQTVPLPTPLAWFFHQLPVAWHHLESYGALALELVFPFFIFGPRAMRRIAFVALTAFQVINFATGNYGFFIPVTLALHAFLLDDSDLRAVGATLRSWVTLPAKLRIAVSDRRPQGLRTVGPCVAFLLIGTWGTLSAAQGADRFLAGRPAESTAPILVQATRALQPFRVVNNYHLFGHITRTRVEPEFQTLDAGRWRSHHLKYKIGDPKIAGPWAAPHQPRVDFRLWFYGLSFEHGTPEYVQTLLRRMCHEPEAVESLFAEPLPRDPDAVRIRFLDYRYTDRETRRETGAWWSTEEVASSAPISCAAAGVGPPRRSR
jgi:hypothetical protein